MRATRGSFSYTRARITAFKHKTIDGTCQSRDCYTKALPEPPSHFRKFISKHKSQNTVMAAKSAKPESLNFKELTRIRAPSCLWQCVVMSALPAFTVNSRQSHVAGLLTYLLTYLLHGAESFLRS